MSNGLPPTARLTARDLSVRYGSGRHAVTAVDGVTFAVEPGTTFGVVGESGSGKSTIARAVTGLVDVAAGDIALDGRTIDVSRARRRGAHARRVQMVFQDPHSSLNPRLRVGETIADGLTMQGAAFAGSRARQQEVERLLALVGLPADSRTRYPHQFSGGQKQRISIARALATGADVLVLDEVTSALDVSVQATILNLLRRLQGELGLTYLFISHDLSIVRVMSHEVAVMYLGRIVEQGPALDVLESSVHPYTAALIDSVPTLLGSRKPAPVQGELPDVHRPPPGCRFHTRCPVGPLFDPNRTICTSVDPGDEAASRLHSSACHFAPSAGAVDSVPVTVGRSFAPNRTTPALAREHPPTPDQTGKEKHQ